MAKCFVTVGVPGCGKSTLAEKISQKHDAQIIERDRIRHMLYGIFDSEESAKMYYKDSDFPKKEKKVNRLWNFLVEVSMENGENIVLSDTFMNPKYLRKIINRMHYGGYNIIILSFLEIDVNVVRMQNENRELSKRVPDNAMKKFIEKIPIMERYLENIKDEVMIIDVCAGGIYD